MHRNKWKWKHGNPKLMGFSKSCAKGKVHNNTGLPQETRGKLNERPNCTQEAIRKRRIEEPQGYYKEINHKN